MPTENGKPNGTLKWLKTTGATIMVVGGAIAIIVTLLVAPVKKDVEACENDIEKNCDAITEIKVDVGTLKERSKDVPTILTLLERFAREYGVPSLDEVPPGEYKSDPPPEPAAVDEEGQ